MLLFRDLKQNYPVFILNKEDITVSPSKVIQVGFPRYDTNVKQTVIDINIECEGKTASYVIPESSSVVTSGNMVIATDKEGLVRELEAMKNNAEQVLKSVERQNLVIEKTTLLLSEYNPAFKEKREIDARFNKIENSVEDIKKAVYDFINEFKK